MVLESLIKLYVPEFSGKHFLSPENWGNGPKIGFFEFKENRGH